MASRFVFSGVADFVAPEQFEAKATLRFYREASKVSNLLGHAGEYSDPATQEDLIREAEKVREIMAEHLRAIDAAIAWTREAAGLVKPKKGAK